MFFTHYRMLHSMERDVTIYIYYGLVMSISPLAAAKGKQKNRLFGKSTNDKVVAL